MLDGNQLDDYYRADIDASYIWVGDGDTPLATTGLTQNAAKILDSGFFRLNPPLQGKNVVIRREGTCMICITNTSLTINEVRVYQTPNLLQALNGTVTVTSSAGSTTASDSVQNLI